MNRESEPEGEPVIAARRPRWTRYYLAVFAVGWYALLAFIVVNAVANGDWEAVPIALLFGAYGAFVLWRTSRLGLFAYADEVVVRNFFKTRRIPKVAVEGFRIGGPAMPMSIGQTIVILVADDTTVSADVFIMSGIGKRDRARLERLVAQLKDWKDAA